MGGAILHACTKFTLSGNYTNLSWQTLAAARASAAPLTVLYQSERTILPIETLEDSD
jgi:hypothetical protein